MNGEKRSILICGAGSIGVFLGAKLLEAGNNVTLFGRKKLAKLHDSILINGETLKDFRAHPAFVTVSIFEGYHLLENQLLATKSGMGWQTESTPVGIRVKDLLESAGIHAVATSDLHKLPRLFWVKRRFYKTIRQIATHYSSMYQDIQSGRPTEIEYLNGYIVRLGKQKGIPASVNEDIYRNLKSLSMIR